MKGLSEMSRRFCYSHETHNLLNHLTLQISDKEIAQAYESFRVRKFLSLYRLMICAVILMFFNGLYTAKKEG